MAFGQAGRAGPFAAQPAATASRSKPEIVAIQLRNSEEASVWERTSMP